MRAVDNAYGLPHWSNSPRLVGILILLLAPLLALIAVLQDSNSGIAGIVTLIMPSLLGIDLLWTGSRPAYSTAVSFGTGCDE
jgi:hypothetical protein